MSDTAERDAVRAEFYARHHHGHQTLTAARAAVRDAMAEEIVQQRRRADRAERILAALREPSESIMYTAYLASFQHTLFDRAWAATLCAAVAAAEQEVGRE